MFTLSISCLTTSNLPWFMDLAFQVLLQYCSLQLRILVPSPDMSTADHCFYFGSATSFFWKLLATALCSSPVAFWTPSNLGDSSFSVVSLCLFIQFMWFSWQIYWDSLPFPPPVDYVFFFQNSPLWPVHLGWPCPAWLIASLSYTSLFSMTRQWSVKGHQGIYLFNFTLYVSLYLMLVSWRHHIIVSYFLSTLMVSLISVV